MMQLCTRCRVHPTEYYSVRGGVCAGCASYLANKYGWSWMRMADDATMGDVTGALGGLTYSANDVQVLKNSELSIIQSLDKDIHKDPTTYSKIPQNVIDSWKQFTLDFGQFYNTNIEPDASSLLVGLPSAGDAMKTAQGYQLQIRDWQKKLSLYINLSSPILPDPSIPVGPPTLGQSLTTVSENLRTIAIVGLCVGAGIFLYALYEGHKTAGKALDFASAHPEVLAL